MTAELFAHGVVTYELRAGATTPAQQSGIDQLLAAFVARQQTLGVSYAAYAQAGRVLAELTRDERLVLASAPPSLFQDAVLAASCREHGATLITENARDFTAIGRHLRGFRFVGPWP